MDSSQRGDNGDRKKKVSSSLSANNPKRPSTSWPVSVLIGILLALTAVGQLFIAPDPHTSSTEGSMSHPLALDPSAWKVGHHLNQTATTAYSVSAIKQQPVSYDEVLGQPKVHYDEVLGGSDPVNPVDYETVQVASTVVDPLLEFLQATGLNISQADRATLPTWASMTQQYGDSLTTGPVVVGMDTCQRYREQVPAARRYVGPAGMFNTGTNAAAYHVQHNLNGIKWKWQIPWGKHRMANVRLSHKAGGMESTVPQDALPIVLIRDPLHWMQSMCKNKYAAHWKHYKTHCPNLVPTETETVEPTGSVQVKIVFDKENVLYWDSLVHLWNDWYRQYLDADYPRLIFRFEDLLLQAPAVMKQVSDCLGVEPVATTNFKFQTGKAKNHGSGTDLLHAVIKTANVTARVKGMTQQDLKFTAANVDPDLMRIFQYHLPDSI